MGVMKQLLTGRDNQTHDLGRWSWAICTSAVIGFAFFGPGAVTVVGLAEALSMVTAAHGIVLRLKKDTEPDALTDQAATGAGHVSAE